MILIAFLALFAAPIAVSATLYAFSERAENWMSADRSSAGLLPQAAAKPEATVRIFAARTVRWRGIFAVHSWIVFKDKGAATYTRYDYTAWGSPIRVNGFAADGRWFGEVPDTVFAADGVAAEKLIPKIKAAIAALILGISFSAAAPSAANTVSGTSPNQRPSAAKPLTRIGSPQAV